MGPVLPYCDGSKWPINGPKSFLTEYRKGLDFCKLNGLLGLVTESNIMNASNSQQILESREDVYAAVHQILKGNHTRFEILDFERSNRIAKLRSQHYASYFILCHENSLRSAGWLICRYAKNDCCPLQKHYKALKRSKTDHQD